MGPLYDYLLYNAGALGVFALIIGLVLLGWWAARRGEIAKPAQREMIALAACGAVVTIWVSCTIVLAVFSKESINTTIHATSIAGAFIGGGACLAFGVRRILARPDNGFELEELRPSRKFSMVVMLLGASAALLALGACLVQGLTFNPVWLQTWYRENFELVAVSSSITSVALAAAVARAWAAASKNSAKDAQVANNFIFLFACAVGVSVLVSIGSSAFAARLAQQQIDSNPNLSRERVQAAVTQIVYYDNQIARDQTEIDRLPGSDPQLERLRLRMRAYDDNKTCVVNQLAEEIQTARTSRGSAPPPRIDPKTPRSPATPSGTGTEDVSHTVARIDAGSNQSDRAALAAMKPTSASPNTGSEMFQLDKCPDIQLITPENQAFARNAVDAARPLERTWMSSQLARRSAVTLSMELVLVMGALGALLRVASLRLRNLGRPADEPPANPEDMSNPANPQRTSVAYDMAVAAGSDSLMPLALNIVLGMATALALFVLMNVTINATSISSHPQTNPGDDLNPFAMAAMGLLGGFASLNVAAWIAEMSLRLPLPKPDREPAE